MVGDCPSRTVRWSWDTQPMRAPSAADPKPASAVQDVFLVAAPLVVGCIPRWAGPSGDRSCLRYPLSAVNAGIPTRCVAGRPTPRVAAASNGRADPAAGQRRNAATSIVKFSARPGEISELDPEQRRRGQAGRLRPSMYPTGTVDDGRHPGSFEVRTKTVPSGTTAPGPGPPSWQSVAGSIDQFRTLKTGDAILARPSAVDRRAFLVAGPRRGGQIASNCPVRPYTPRR